jgi:hypothetical protein
MAQLADVLASHDIDAASLTHVKGEPGADFHRLAVPGVKAISIWKQLRLLVDEIGHWPLLIGDDERAEVMIDRLLDGGEAAAESNVVAEEWLANRVKDEPDLFDCPLGTWPQPQPNHSFIIPMDMMTGQPLAEVQLLLVPTRISHQVPALIGFGGWNDCPMPDVQAAMMKRWNSLYGAELVGIAADVVEMRVTRPPTNREAAELLAREQFIYCTDIVYQGVETLRALASALMNGSSWYFWWD